MGGFNMPDNSRRQAAVKKSQRYKRNRPGIRFDMTPMVDIAFLLLIFYMVSTVFSMPQSLELNLPPKKSGNVMIKESKVLNLWVNDKDQLFWHHNESSTEKMDLPQLITLSDLRELLLEKNSHVQGLVTVLKIDPESRYETMVLIVDEIQTVERIFKQRDEQWSYRFSIDDISEWEIEQMAEALKVI